MNRLIPALAMVLWVSAAFGDFSHEYNSGIFFFKRNEFELAAQTFERLIDRFPGDPRLDAAVFWAGQAYERAGQFSKAFGLYARLVSDFPKSGYREESMMLAGEAALRGGGYADALPYFSALADARGVDQKTAGKARAGLADSYLRMGDDARAEKVLRQLMVMPQYPRDKRFEAEVRLRQLMIRTGRGAEARQMFERSNQNSDLAQAELMIFRGDDAFAQGRFGESRRHYEQAYKRYDLPPDLRAAAIYKTGLAAARMGDDAHARQLLMESAAALAALPDVRAGSSLNLGQISSRMGRSEDAERMARAGEQIVRSAPSPGGAEVKDDLIYLRAESAYRQGKYDEALDHLSRSDQDGYRQRRLQAMILFETGKFPAAAEAFERAARQAPDDASRAECSFDIARCWMELNSLDRALAELDQIRGSSPDLAMRVRSARADVLFRLGRMRESASDYQTLARDAANPDDQRLYRFYAALASFKDRNFTRAEKLLNRLSALGGIPQGPGTDPAAFLEAAMEMDRAIDFAVAGRERDLQEKMDAILSRRPDTPLQVFAMDRLREREFHPLLARLSRSVLLFLRPGDRLFGRAAFNLMLASEKTGDRRAARSALDDLVRWSEVFPDSEYAEEVAYRQGLYPGEDGNAAASLNAYQTYLKKYPTGRYAREATAALSAQSKAAVPPRPEVSSAESPAAAVPEPPDPGVTESVGRGVVGQIDKTLFQTLLTHYENKRYDALESEFNRLFDRIRDVPLRSRASFLMGMARFKSGRFREAIPFLQRVEDPPGSDWVIESKVRLAESNYQLKRYSEALDYYTKVIKNYPKSQWAEESFKEAQLCRLKLGRTGDALIGYEKFLQENPSSPQVPDVALEAARLYLKAEDLDGAERMLDMVESHGGPKLEESLRMRLDISGRRNQIDRLIQLTKTYLSQFGMNLDIAVTGAIAATGNRTPFDPFGLAGRGNLDPFQKTLEEAFRKGGQPLKSQLVDQKFYGSSRDVDIENTLICSLKRILYGQDRVVMIIETKAVSFVNDALPAVIREIALAGKDVTNFRQSFVTGVQVGEEFPIRHTQTRCAAVSILRTEWPEDAVLSMTVEFNKRKIALATRVQAKLD